MLLNTVHALLDNAITECLLTFFLNESIKVYVLKNLFDVNQPRIFRNVTKGVYSCRAKQRLFTDWIT